MIVLDRNRLGGLAAKAAARATVTLTLILCASPAHLAGQAKGFALPAALLFRTQAVDAASNTHRAVVSYASGLLTVTANDSSLNQILRDVAHETGMKITGGVAEDRVFGTYGPAPASTVLAKLLDGTGSNLLLVQTSADAPRELILSHRVGGVTPPNPNAQGNEASEGSSESTPQAVRQYFPPPSPPASSRAPYRSGTGGMEVNPAATAPSSTSQPVAFPPIDGSTPPAVGTTTPVAPDSSSDTVKTPQQIFEQLQKLRQQQPTTPQK